MIRPSPAPVIDTHANHEENVERIVKLLGRNKLRLQVWDFVHGRGNRPKTVTQIIEGLALKSGRRQVLLNQVNHLAKHRLVSKSVVPARGRGGNEFAYGKIDFCMANKQEILRNVANPKLARGIPTKRRPQISAVLNARSLRIGASGRRPKLKVLYLQATPASQLSLRTDAEFRMVQDEVRGSKFRDQIEFISSPAADAKKVLDGINDHRPQIVHFSGHGGSRSIWLDDGKVEKSVGRPLKFDLLAEALGATSSPPALLVLNACDTLAGAQALLDSVKIVIAMSNTISDMGAATFAAQFYAAIASAQPVSVALKQGKLAMKLASLSASHLPEMICRKGEDPKRLVLVRKR